MSATISPSPQQHPRHIAIVSATAMMTAGAALLIAGFIVPPPGEIHSSVLVAFGEIMTFVGTIFGINSQRRSNQ